ncbi:MAG: hypothetical protein IPF96_17345 [Rhodobacter sp.]|nr:hypothetical protein [Rhodobacter sp.]
MDRTAWICSIALAFAAPSMARAALDPCAYDTLVRQADSVVQIAEISVTREPFASFRGDLHEGDAVTVQVGCEWDGTEGPRAYQDRAALEAAALIELHLVGGAVAGQGAGLEILDAARKGEMSYDWNCD